MSATITGTVSPVVASQCVSAYPTGWPLTNIAGGNLTDPGIVTTLTDASGNWSLAVPANTNMTIAEPNKSYSGTTPADGTTTSTTSLTTSDGWTTG